MMMNTKEQTYQAEIYLGLDAASAGACLNLWILVWGAQDIILCCAIPQNTIGCIPLEDTAP